MGFFNQNDFKYIIKRIIIILGVLIIASMFKKVFGYTTWTAPDGETYNIPDYTLNSNYSNYIILCGKSSDTLTKKVILFQTNGGQFALQQVYYNQQYPSLTRCKNLGDGTLYNILTSQALNNNTSWNERNNEPITGNSGWNSTLPTAVFNDNYCFVYSSNQNIDLYNNDRELIKNVYSINTDPYIENNSTDIEDWSFENLSINYGTLTYDRRDYLRVTYFNSTTGQNYGDFDLNLSLYADTVGAGVLVNPINIPQQRLNNTIVFKENFKIGFILVHFTDEQGNTQNYSLSDSPYIVSISSSYVNDLNDNADRNIQNDILNQTEENNQQLKDLNDNLTSSDIDEDAITFPTIDVQDGGVLNAMSSFFDKIYNAFTNGTLLDIVIPIPFTDKNIVIPYDYTATQLRNANASWIIDIIQLGWWYIIGRYIIINLFEKVILMMRGSIDRVQMNNITTKLL